MKKVQKKQPTHKKTTHKKANKPRHFGGLFSGRQQKGKAAIAVVLLFAAVGSFLLWPSYAATTTVAPTGTYTDWNWPGQNYTSFDWQVIPGIDQTGPDSYFFSHQFGLVNGNGGYSGLQGDYNGKRAIFSLWDTMAAKGPEIAQPFGGEGIGYQTVIKYNWVVGRAYQFHVQKEATDPDGIWWSSSVKDTVTGIVSPIGQIKVPLAWGGLSNFSIVWTERYGGQMATCNDIHHSLVTFSNFTANNGTVAPSSHYNHLSDPVNCPGSQITDVRNGVKQEMGVGNDLPPTIPAGSGKSLSDLTPSYLSNGYGALKKDLSTGDHILTLNGQRYARGLGVHANADIRYSLGGQYSTFKANVGVDDEVGNSGSVLFQVWADGVKLFDSGLMTGPTPTQAVNVNVAGKQELKLIVTDGADNINFDHADWGDARLTQGDATAPSVAISSPANGARVGYWTPVSAQATDNVQVTKMEVYIDGTLRASSSTSSISYTWVSYYDAAGSHTITVKAYDAAGNVGQSSVVVTK